MPKRKINNFQFDEVEVKEEYVENTQIPTTDWSCIEIDQGTSVQRIISFDKVTMHLSDSGEAPSIGDRVQTNISGNDLTGTLICNSEMGITMIDLFNDILTATGDLQNFLKQCNVSLPSNEQPGMIIQAYLAFCKNVSSDVWQPIQACDLTISTEESFTRDDESFDEIIDPLGDYEELAMIGPSDGELSDDSDSSGFLQTRKKVKSPKKRKVSGKKDDQTKLVEEIAVACRYCTKTPDCLQLWEQNKYDRVMSKHLWIKHNIKDDLMQENEEAQELMSQKIKIPEKIQIGGSQVIPCIYYPACNSHFKKVPDVHRHVKYHKDLKSSPRNVLDYSSFPCLQCDRSFKKYRDLKIHEDSIHPKFQYPCRFCDKIYNTRQNRNQHWDLIHKSDVEKTCEFCGKLFKNSRQLREHLRSHDESNHCTCDICGKHFKNHYALRKHSKWHQEASEPCPICHEKFIYQDAVETHLVRVHGQERKYTCEYCGTQFIHQKHWRRHMNKHESNPEKIYRTQPVRRGYTKNTSEYWQTKPGNTDLPGNDFPALPYPDQAQIPMAAVPVAPFHGSRESESQIHEVS